MGMPCEVNAVLKLSPEQGYPEHLKPQAIHTVTKSGYRILPIDVPLPLVDAQWMTHADIVVQKLTWANKTTHLTFLVYKIHGQPMYVGP